MRRNTVHRVLGMLLVALFLSYYAGATLFVHTHTTAEGSVTHSHPYLPSSAHGHSAVGFAAINALTDLCFVVSAVVWVGVLGARYVAFLVEKVVATRVARVAWSLLRGPPVGC